MDFIIFDVETTGLSPRLGDRIVEIAALKVSLKDGLTLNSRNFKRIDRFHSLVDPQREISYEAYLVNRITQKMLSGAPKSQDILPTFVNFIKNACVVGHNISFDIGFLSSELSYHRWSLPEGICVCDTRKMAKALIPDLYSYSLSSVAYALGLKSQQKHRAFEDVMMTYRVFGKLLDQLEKRKLNQVEILSLLFGDHRKIQSFNHQKKILKLKEAILSFHSIDFVYASLNSLSITKRRVTPKQLIDTGQHVFLVGFCHSKKEERTFRVDRIVSLESEPSGSF